MAQVQQATMSGSSVESVTFSPVDSRALHHPTCTFIPRTFGEESREWVLVIFDEEQVVGERRHGDADLRQVVEVLQRRALLQHQPVVDRLGQQKGGRQVL